MRVSAAIPDGVRTDYVFTSAECHFSLRGKVNPACTCECDGEQVSIRDERCAGFGGIEGDMVDVGVSPDAK